MSASFAVLRKSTDKARTGNSDVFKVMVIGLYVSIAVKVSLEDTVTVESSNAWSYLA